MHVSRLLTAFSAAGALAAALAASTASADDAKAVPDAKHGRALFGEHCSVCHGAKAEGGFGPSLKDEIKRKNADQIRLQIMKPEPPMAKLYPDVISAKDVDDIVAFVTTL